jgi:hypothetical protein
MFESFDKYDSPSLINQFSRQEYLIYWLFYVLFYTQSSKPFTNQTVN